MIACDVDVLMLTPHFSRFGYNKAQMEYLLQLLPPLNELTDGSVLNGQLNWCPHATEVSQCDPKSR